MVGIACKGGVPEWRRNLTHELNLDDKPESYNEYELNNNMNNNVNNNVN